MNIRLELRVAFELSTKEKLGVEEDDEGPASKLKERWLLLVNELPREKGAFGVD